MSKELSRPKHNLLEQLPSFCTLSGLIEDDIRDQIGNKYHDLLVFANSVEAYLFYQTNMDLVNDKHLPLTEKIEVTLSDGPGVASFDINILALNTNRFILIEERLIKNLKHILSIAIHRINSGGKNNYSGIVNYNDPSLHDAQKLFATPCFSDAKECHINREIKGESLLLQPYLLYNKQHFSYNCDQSCLIDTFVTKMLKYSNDSLFPLPKKIDGTFYAYKDIYHGNGYKKITFQNYKFVPIPSITYYNDANHDKVSNKNEGLESKYNVITNLTSGSEMFNNRRIRDYDEVSLSAMLLSDNYLQINYLYYRIIRPNDNSYVSLLNQQTIIDNEVRYYDPSYSLIKLQENIYDRIHFLPWFNGDYRKSIPDYFAKLSIYDKASLQEIVECKTKSPVFLPQGYRSYLSFYNLTVYDSCNKINEYTIKFIFIMDSLRNYHDRDIIFQYFHNAYNWTGELVIAQVYKDYDKYIETIQKYF